MTQSQAYKSGFCDAIFNREAQAPQSWQHAPRYLAGYIAGKESGVIFCAPPPVDTKPDRGKALQRGAFLQALA